MSAFPDRPIPTSSIYDLAGELIEAGQLDAITSDVFDTIVTRDTARPADVFTTVGAELRDRGLLPESLRPDAFRRCRIDAESNARLAVLDARRGRTFDRRTDPDEPAPECTIEEIWNEVERAIGVDPSIGIDVELDVESRRLRVLPEAVRFLENARAANLPVHLVSDTYLSSGQLTDLLRAVGVSEVLLESVTTSSDHRLSKVDGLLATTIERLGLEPARVVHIGDNPLADVAAAAAAGAQALEADLHPDLVVVDRGGERVDEWSARHGTDLGLTSTLRASQLSAGVAALPAYQFGASALGPPMFGFARWIVDTTEALGVSSVHGLLREGATIVELIRAAHPDRPLPDLRLVHASRWVDVRAACIDGSTDEIAEMLGRRDPLDVDDIAATLGCPAEPLRSLIGDRPVDPADVRELAAAIHRDDALRTATVEFSASLRQRVLHQLRAELDLDADRVVLVDVGWGGRIQHSIEKILRAGGHDQPVTGLYFALSQTGERRIASGADMRSYVPHRFDADTEGVDGPPGAPGATGRDIAHHADTVERVLTPDIATFVDVDDDATPIVADRTEHRPTGVDLAARGMFDTVEALAAGTVDPRWTSSASWRDAVSEPLRSVVLTPHPLVARELSTWHHDDVGGRGAAALGGDGEVVERIRHASALDLDTLVDQRAVWVDGLAAEHHPTLLAQRHAMRHGLPATTAAPATPGGIVRLSVFRHGADEPTAQRLHEVSTTATGWNAIALRAEAQPIRAIRFDPGELELLVEVGTVRLTTDDGTATDEFVGVADPRIIVVGGRTIDDRRLVLDRGGHLLLPVPSTGDASGLIGPLDVFVSFRRWRLDPDDPALVEPRTEAARRIAMSSARRVRGVVRRLRS